MEETYEDTYYAEDAIYMERNSRDFAARVQRIDMNTEMLCDWLHARSLAATDPIAVHGRVIIKNVCYPKWETRQHYDRCRTGNSCGFGGLFSLTFTSLLASRTFFDALRTHKGPSLGTNFTLACPYTILAHYGEMEWAEGWGVESGLVRVSVGMESGEEVKVLFEAALQEAARRVGEEEVGRKPYVSQPDNPEI
jgi:cystathionine gamma-synthase